jgi:SHAQKYF class myb-like DNA-binding protein
MSDSAYTLSSQTVHFTNSYESIGGSSCHQQQYTDQSYQPSNRCTWAAQSNSSQVNYIDQPRLQPPQDAQSHAAASSCGGHFPAVQNLPSDCFHPAPIDNFCAPHRPSVDEYAHCPAQQQQQHDAWTTGPGFGNHAAPQLPAAPLFSHCAAAPAPPAASATPPAEGSLEHFRNAFIELSRQNFLLRRQLSAAEERLRLLDAAAPAPANPRLDGDGAPQAPPASPECGGRGAPRPRTERGGAGGAAERERRARFWSKAEHERFLEGVRRFGSQDAHSIAWHVGTRTVTQVRTHAQKYFLKVGRDGGASGAGAAPAEGGPGDGA